jgi:hypothetical protein
MYNEIWNIPTRVETTLLDDQSKWYNFANVQKCFKQGEQQMSVFRARKEDSYLKYTT